MKKNFIPSKAGDRDTWFENFLAVVDGIATTLGIAAADVTPVKAKVTNARNKYTAAQTALAGAGRA